MSGSGVRALIIEDNVNYAELLKEMLAEQTISSRHAGSLDEGLKRLSEEAYDVVLLDLGLPDAEGYASCEMLRKRHPAVPIVIVSGHPEEEEFAMRCFQHGAQDYLQKGGFDRKLLVRSLRYAMQRKIIESEHHNTQQALMVTNQRLKEKLGELDRLNMLMMGREERILELKEELKQLRAKTDKPRRSAHESA